MIRQDAYPVEPRCVRETSLDLALLAQSESLFALSNGHVGLRGNLDEGEPHGLPGTYLNSFHELRPLPYAEAGYGYPESGQAIVNVTNGKVFRLLVDDEPFDVRYGTLHRHERSLDLRTGVLRREVEWTSPAGRRIVVRSRRVVSLTQRSIAAISYSVALADGAPGPVRLVVQSELVANEDLSATREVAERTGDPRLGATQAPLEDLDQVARDAGALLVHRTTRSGLLVAAAMDHGITGPDGTRYRAECFPDLGRVTVTSMLGRGESAAEEELCLTKYVAYGWSGQRSLPALRDQVAAALAAARDTGWERLLADQRAFLDDFWAVADVRVDGDAELQQAVRFALFHVMQAGARAERRPIGAKGLTGTGYDGHCFWDTESFVLQVLTYTMPHAVADALAWRHSILPAARERAAQLGLAGAAFPWRTIAGEECSAYWPAGTAAFHVNADIADAVARYVAATGDAEFERVTGLPILVETARLWRRLGHHDASGGFRIDGVTGPDEYSAVVDNNVFTNLMAARNLRAAAAACARHVAEAGALGVDTEETAGWRDAASAMVVPYDERLGVHPQSEGFTDHAVFDFARTPPEAYPLLLSVPYFELYRKQVVKQADLVLAMHLCGSEFTPEQKRRNVDYYEQLTVRDSSLSAATQAVLAAEVGHLDLALDYTAETAFIDLRDLAQNTRNGLHLAALAGTWIALVAGFGGLRDCGTGLELAPKLPRGLTGLAFGVRYRGGRLSVEICPAGATYTWDAGGPFAAADQGPAIRFRHHGEEVVLGPKESATLPVPPAPDLPRPGQPAGRGPSRRGMPG